MHACMHARMHAHTHTHTHTDYCSYAFHAAHAQMCIITVNLPIILGELVGLVTATVSVEATKEKRSK